MNLEVCFQKRLLKKIPSSIEKAEKNLQSAKQFLEDANANFSEERIESALLLAYTAALNAVKSLLFSEGIAEVSHFCSILYLRKHHPELEELVETFNNFRIKRHSTQYSGIGASELETKDYIDFTKEFIDTVDDIITKK